MSKITLTERSVVKEVYTLEIDMQLVNDVAEWFGKYIVSGVPLGFAINIPTLEILMDDEHISEKRTQIHPFFFNDNCLFYDKENDLSWTESPYDMIHQFINDRIYEQTPVRSDGSAYEVMTTVV